jgi:type IV secretion system protein VirB4
LIEGLLGDSPTIVSIEETWFFLDNPSFAARIDNFIRTLGKRNGSLWMVTQNLQEIRDCSIASSIMSNIPNTLFLPDKSIGQFSELYQDFGGLLPEEVQRIAEAIEKRHYYLKTPNTSRMLDVAFPDEIVVCISSGSRVRRTFEEHYNTRDTTPEWRENYYTAITNGIY